MKAEHKGPTYLIEYPEGEEKIETVMVSGYGESKPMVEFQTYGLTISYRYEGPRRRVVIPWHRIERVVIVSEDGWLANEKAQGDTYVP